MVELQPSKLITWVRFPSPAPFSSAHIAQEVEHFLGKEEVTGSNPVMGSIWLRPAYRRLDYWVEFPNAGLNGCQRYRCAAWRQVLRHEAEGRLSIGSRKLSAVLPNKPVDCNRFGSVRRSRHYGLKVAYRMYSIIKSWGTGFRPIKFLVEKGIPTRFNFIIVKPQKHCS